MTNTSKLSKSEKETFKNLLEKQELVTPSIESSSVFQKNQDSMISYAENNDWEGLNEFIDNRVNSKIYLSALEKLNELSEKRDSLGEVVDTTKTKSKSKNSQEAFDGFVQLRDDTKTYREAHEEYAYHLSKIDEFRSLTARAVNASSILQRQFEKENNSWLEFNEKTIGDLVVGGNYEANTPQWHEDRAQGIGGSDVGSIMRVDNEYHSKNYMEVLNLKLGLIEPGDKKYDTTTAIGRGNAWEEYIRHRVQDKNPDLNVAFCKSNWKGKGDFSYRHANFDGLFLDDNGKPEGILEIKTGSDLTKWGDTGDGLFGVPEQYRKQVLWYAANAGLKWGKIVSVLLDNDYREYDFVMDDSDIQKEVAEIFEATDKFWSLVQTKKQELEEQCEKKKVKRNSLKPKEPVKNIAHVLSLYSDISNDEATEIVSGKIAEAKKSGELTAEKMQETVFEIFATVNPQNRTTPLVGLDIEASSFSPKTGRILETGVVQYNHKDGSFDVLYDSLHGLNDKALYGVGVGASDVHHITPERIVGKTLFEDEAEKILDFLVGKTMVAHNSDYEERFLSVDIPGFVEAKNDGAIKVLDTMKVSKYLIPDTPDNTLESFSECNGVPYVDAHAACKDVEMMLHAFINLQNKVYSRK